MNDAVKACFSKYVTFSGRASRYEFWKFVLFLLLVSIVLTLVNSILFGPTVSHEIKISINADGEPTTGLHRTARYDAGWLGFVFNIAVALPLLAVAWRRMHDIGRPGFFVLLPIAGLAATFAVIYLTLPKVAVDQASSQDELVAALSNIAVPGPTGAIIFEWLIAVASLVIVIVWLALGSQHDPNKYGPNPNEVPQ